MDRFSQDSPLDLVPRHRRLERDEAFYVESLPCESCGRPCDEGRVLVDDLLVGQCCISGEVDIPFLPVCAEYGRLVEAAETVGQLLDSVKAHNSSCVLCQGVRKGIQSEGRKELERGAA